MSEKNKESIQSLKKENPKELAAAKKRETFPDFLRIIACFFVIVNHTNSTIFLSRTPESPVWFVSLAYFFLSKVAVPVFFMISGYFMLNKKDTWKKTFARFFRMVVVLIVCAIIYAFYSFCKGYPAISETELLKKIFLVYLQTPSNAFWYLYAYLGILLMMPFLQKMTAAMEKRDYHIFFALSGLFVGLFPILRHFNTNLYYNEEFYIPLFSGYLCMLLIGQYFSRFPLKKTKMGFFLAILLLLSMVGFNVVATYFEFQKSTDSYLFFDNRTFLPIVIESVCIFYLATFVRFKNRAAHIISYIGACTFGIYLLSDLLINWMNPLLVLFEAYMHPFFAVLIFEIAIFASGFLLTAILKKIPLIKKFL